MATALTPSPLCDPLPCPSRDCEPSPSMVLALLLPVPLPLLSAAPPWGVGASPQRGREERQVGELSARWGWRASAVYHIRFPLYVTCSFSLDAFHIV